MFCLTFALCIVVVYLSGPHRDLHVLTRSFPTRRSSDLWKGRAALPDARRPWPRHIPAMTDPMLVFDRALLRRRRDRAVAGRSAEHTSELQSLLRSSYAVFCLKKQKTLGTTPV